MPELINPGPLEFDALIQRADVTGSAAFVEIPFDVPKLFGTRGRVPVAAEFDGEPYRGSMVNYGGPHLLLILTAIQDKLGKHAGDNVHVTLELDTRSRTVEIGEDTAAALDAAELTDRFRGMSYSHQREYAEWIAEAKRPETTQRRIAKMLTMIGEGKALR